MNSFSQSAQRIPFAAAIAFTSGALPLLPFGAGAQQQNPPPAHDMEHMQHNHGGFMQEGMHHAVARGIKIEQQVDSASHTITLREGPMTRPSRTGHMKMPNPPYLFWSIPIDGWLIDDPPHHIHARDITLP